MGHVDHAILAVIAAKKRTAALFLEQSNEPRACSKITWQQLVDQQLGQHHR